MNIKTTIFSRLVPSVAVLVSICFGANGRDFRTGSTFLPNAQFSCLTCHTSPFGGAGRNAFGERVRQLVTVNGREQFWATIFAEDSDGDGIPNGVELGDTDGDLQIDRGPSFSNPGDSSDTISLPNTAPTITSTAITTAVKGIAYSYTAAANDSEGHAISFSKVTGPDWLTVASNGAITGTPPDAANASEAVTIRALDNGSPPASVDQSYTLTITASFLGWQRLNFGTGENDPNAGARTIAPGRANPNLIKYALRGSPTANDTLAFPLSFNGSQQGTFFIDIRDDDPNLSVVAEVSNRIDFSNATTITPTTSDPTPNDGRKRLSFADSVANSSGVIRFIRLKFSD